MTRIRYAEKYITRLNSNKKFAYLAAERRFCDDLPSRWHRNCLEAVQGFATWRGIPLRTDSKSYCEAVIGANALLEILIDTPSTAVSALRFTPLTTSRDRL